MNPDESYASLICLFLLIIVLQENVSAKLLEILLSLGRPLSTILLLTLLGFAYNKGLHFTFLALALLIIVLLKKLWTWVRSDERRLYLEVGRDNDRFDPALSVDIQVANGTIKPKRAYFPENKWEMLVFPPSKEVLKEMNGD